MLEPGDFLPRFLHPPETRLLHSRREIASPPLSASTSSTDVSFARRFAMSTLEVRDLGIEAGGVTVVEGLTFGLRAGDKIGVVGRNGAGKTSTLKVLAGEA